ncbi:cytochrome c oxidase subunit II transmembrane domain-containing protein [Lyngbya aestuarii]|uniref:cytochrome c oxidase subunit II transmembrane domain-containing protein n=1 Tax=Lyngbya aestuarii TaxID=118322 RepID=UPI00403E29B3
MLRILEYILLAIGVAIIVAFSYWIGQQSYSWMPVQASTDAKQIDDLFSFLVWMSAIIFLGVVGMIGYSLITCRAPAGDYREGHPMRGNAKIEAAWTITPVLLVLWIVGYSFYIYQKMDVGGPRQLIGELNVPLAAEPAYAQAPGNNTPAPPTIEVIAKQWVWAFHYPQQNITSNELHLPVNQRARLLLQSDDVIHGFYVPEFRIKQDIIPNRPIDFQFIPSRVGKYRLKDSQFSGTYFALMQADVYVDNPEDYAQWLTQAANQQPISAPNQAATEHEQPANRLFKTNWYTVLPAPSTDVNYASRTLPQASVENPMILSEKEGNDQ